MVSPPDHLPSSLTYICFLRCRRRFPLFGSIFNAVLLLSYYYLREYLSLHTSKSPLRKEGWKCTQSNPVLNHSKCKDLATRLEAIISRAADNQVFAFSLWNLIPTQHYPDRSHFLSLVTTDKSHGEYMWQGPLNSGKDGLAARRPVNYLMRRTPRMMTINDGGG